MSGRNGHIPPERDILRCLADRRWHRSTDLRHELSPPYSRKELDDALYALVSGSEIGMRVSKGAIEYRFY